MIQKPEFWTIAYEFLKFTIQAVFDRDKCVEFMISIKLPCCSPGGTETGFPFPRVVDSLT